MKKLIITGPESSGKTTLFNQLTSFYNITGVDEYAREYIANLKRDPTITKIYLKLLKFNLLMNSKFITVTRIFLFPIQIY